MSSALTAIDLIRRHAVVAQSGFARDVTALQIVADRVARPLATVPTEPLAPTDGWCDDPTHRDYNRQIVLPHDARHEELWRRDNLYDLLGVLG